MTQRRDFIRQASLLAAGSVTASGLAAGGAEAQGLAPAAKADWDMSWTERVTGKYRMVFDAPEFAEGGALHQARVFLSGYADAYGLTDKDLTAVIVARHTGVTLVLDDELWSDGVWGEKEKLKDPETGEVAKRNPFIRVKEGSRHALTWADGALDTLMSRGVIVLACDLALRGVTSQVAQRRKIDRKEAAELVAKHTLPGVYRMPSGIFATAHAQQVGCGFLRATG